MQNIIGYSTVCIENSEYAIYKNEIFNCGRIYTLKKGNRKYIFKLVDAGCENSGEWEMSLFYEHERTSMSDSELEALRKRGIRFPKAYAFVREIPDMANRICPCGLMEEYICGTKLSEAETDIKTLVSACLDITKTVRYMNIQKGLFHMDIVGNNAMLDDSGHCWLVDFTGAWILEDDETPAGYHRPYRRVNAGSITGAVKNHKGRFTANDLSRLQYRLIVDLMGTLGLTDAACLTGGEQNRLKTAAGAADPLAELEKILTGRLNRF